jgi:hypothetical protein
LWGRLCTEGTSENSCETCTWKTKLNVKFVKIAFRSKFHRIFKYMKQNSFNCHNKAHNILKMLVISGHVDNLSRVLRPFNTFKTFQDLSRPFKTFQTYQDLPRLSRSDKTFKTFQDFRDLLSLSRSVKTVKIFQDH